MEITCSICHLKRARETCYHCPRCDRSVGSCCSFGIILNRIGDNYTIPNSSVQLLYGTCKECHYGNK